MQNDSAYLLNIKQGIERLLINNSKSYSELLNPKEVVQVIDKNIMVDDNDAVDILSNDDYEDGTYGFLNYKLNLQYDDSFPVKEYTYHNKASIVKKIIKNNNLTEEGIEHNYGILELYSKEKEIITNLKKYYLLKGGNINYINSSNHDNINIESLNDDFIITKIYKIETKITLKTIFTKEEYFIKNDDDISEAEPFIKYDKLVKQLCSNNTKLLNYMFNFDNIYKFNKIMDDGSIEDTYDITDVLNHDFSKYIDNIRISNKYKMDEYNNLLNKYYSLSIDDIHQDICNRYVIIDKIRPALKILIDILFRMYIDITISTTGKNIYNIPYNLHKDIIQYIPSGKCIFEQMSKQALIDRHWKKILLLNNNNNLSNDDIKVVIQSIFHMLKTNTLIDVLTYLSNLMNV